MVIFHSYVNDYQKLYPHEYPIVIRWKSRKSSSSPPQVDGAQTELFQAENGLSLTQFLGIKGRWGKKTSNKNWAIFCGGEVMESGPVEIFQDEKRAPILVPVCWCWLDGPSFLNGPLVTVHVTFIFELCLDQPRPRTSGVKKSADLAKLRIEPIKRGNVSNKKRRFDHIYFALHMWIPHLYLWFWYILISQYIYIYISHYMGHSFIYIYIQYIEYHNTWVFWSAAYASQKIFGIGESSPWPNTLKILFFCKLNRLAFIQSCIYSSYIYIYIHTYIHNHIYTNTHPIYHVFGHISSRPDKHFRHWNVESDWDGLASPEISGIFPTRNGGQTQ